MLRQKIKYQSMEITSPVPRPYEPGDEARKLQAYTVPAELN